MTAERPVAVVTGGGGGIGAAIAEELGRRGWFVTTLDPLVSLDGAERLPEPAETTADRIVAAGGAARASAASVTDAAAVRDVLEGLAGELGRLDAVVNVAGISRPSGFASGTEEDWRSVLSVHLDGYRNVLEAALPIMAKAGTGRVVGVTSGSGWRAADAGAYSCAKRAVAALTWQLGRCAPPGVAVNAISPIAVTRMVTAALARAAGRTASAGNLSLGAMPAPQELGPLAAHLADVDWCSGQVLFAGGSEVAVVDPPRLLEVVRADADAALAHVLELATAKALAPAEAAQLSGGGSNPRLAASSADPLPAPVAQSCAVVTDRAELLDALRSALADRGVACRVVPVPDPTAGFAGAAEALGSAGEVDGVIVALAGSGTVGGAGSDWERVLAEHQGLAGSIATDAGWARAVAEDAARRERPVRLVALTDAVTAGGRSRAQASAQLARAGQGATGGRVSAYAVSLEAGDTEALRRAGVLAAHLVASPDAAGLAGAELVATDGWVGLRSHPRPATSISLLGAELPVWFDEALREAIR